MVLGVLHAPPALLHSGADQFPDQLSADQTRLTRWQCALFACSCLSWVILYSGFLTVFTYGLCLFLVYLVVTSYVEGVVFHVLCPMRLWPPQWLTHILPQVAS